MRECINVCMTSETLSAPLLQDVIPNTIKYHANSTQWFDQIQSCSWIKSQLQSHLRAAIQEIMKKVGARQMTSFFLYSLWVCVCVRIKWWDHDICTDSVKFFSFFQAVNKWHTQTITRTLTYSITYSLLYPNSIPTCLPLGHRSLAFTVSSD